MHLLTAAPPSKRTIWRLGSDGQLCRCPGTNTEVFITHNGDFEFFEMLGKLETVEFVQEWLIETLHAPMPSGTDSCAVAGMMDLIRTQVTLNPNPNTVCAVVGMMDLIRTQVRIPLKKKKKTFIHLFIQSIGTQGDWFAATRFASVVWGEVAGLKGAGSLRPEVNERVAQMCDEALVEVRPP
jgi:hypothetical protein